MFNLRKIFLMLLTVLFIFTCDKTTGPTGPIVVQFPDANLETLIRNAIDKLTGDILDTDLTGIRTLELDSEDDIVDLTGIEYCTKLTILDLYRNDIIDISPLSGLTKLEELYLGDNKIIDISALSGLTQLKYLVIGGYDNDIDDISALSGLTKLENLVIGGFDETGVNISDISALSGLTKLENLNIYGNNVSDISALGGLTNLEYLNLGDNNISDIIALVDNTGIGSGDYVVLEYNPLSNISKYTYIPQLEARGVSVYLGFGY